MSNELGERAAAAAESRVEAARYAVLRRLAPAMRHHMVVHLQPIGMVYEVMERRLAADQPDMAKIQDSAAKINAFARAALDSCLDVVTWLSPEDGAVTGVKDGVAECLGLLGNGFNFRGFTLRNQVDVAGFTVRRSAMRNVLSACLITVTDAAQAPADIVLSATTSAGNVFLSVRIEQTEGSAGFPYDGTYRRLTWDDVEALAQSEGVMLSHDSRSVTMTLSQVG